LGHLKYLLIMRISIFYFTARIKSRSARKDKCVGHNITLLPPRFYSALKLKLSSHIKIPNVYKREFQYFASNLQVARTDFLYSEDVFVCTRMRSCMDAQR